MLARSTSTSTWSAPTSGATLIRHHLDECAPCLREYGIEQEVKALVARCCGNETAPERAARAAAGQDSPSWWSSRAPSPASWRTERRTALINTGGPGRFDPGHRCARPGPELLILEAGVPADDQELGRLPWLAALFLRAFFLRDFFAMLPPGWSRSDRGERGESRTGPPASGSDR